MAFVEKACRGCAVGDPETARFKQGGGCPQRPHGDAKRAPRKRGALPVCRPWVGGSGLRFHITTSCSSRKPLLFGSRQKTVSHCAQRTRSPEIPRVPALRARKTMPHPTRQCRNLGSEARPPRPTGPRPHESNRLARRPIHGPSSQPPDAAIKSIGCAAGSKKPSRRGSSDVIGQLILQGAASRAPRRSRPQPSAYLL